MKLSAETILIVDDDPAVVRVLEVLLGQAGWRTRTAQSGQEALRILALDSRIGLVLTDLRMDGMDGMQLLDSILSKRPDLPVILLTAHGSVPLAVAAMRKGAADFIQKPFERDELLFAVKKATVQPASVSTGPARTLLGSSERMKQLKTLIQQAATSQAAVLIRGESGTGKELVARALHASSPRAQGPLITVHCAGIPDTLLESELFGYEKGAFTGAVQRKPGRIELAAGGTLFLDEMGELTTMMQVKLLRLLQEKEYERLGGTQTLKADVRIVSATHRNLEGMIADGTFRSDLYYRLNVIPIWVPPLRERREDLPELIQHFLSQSAAENGRSVVSCEPGVVELLSKSEFPGDVRELQNLVERLVVLSPGSSVSLQDVARELASRTHLSMAPEVPDSGGLQQTRRSAEREAVLQALRQAQGNRSLAARLLGVSRRTLYNKLSELELEDV